MKRISIYTISLLMIWLPVTMWAQSSNSNLFYNQGAQVYVQSGGVLHVQGDYVNTSSGTTTNNGLINVEGDITNTATFNYSGSGEQTVRLIGNSTVAGSAVTGEQSISGLNTAGSLYNLVVDRGAGQVVRLNSDVTVDGSLVWNSANTAATYTPSSYASTLGNSTLMQIRGATPTGNGLIKLYDNVATNDYELYVSNDAANAVTGYQAISAYSFTGSRAATTKDNYIETRANATVSKGFARKTGTSSLVYIFPVGGVTSTYNPIKVYFKTLTGGSIKLSSKFTDNTALSDSSFYNHFDKGNSIGAGAVLDTTRIPIDYTNNPGYNVYQAGTCGGVSKWFIMNKASLHNHGYWSFNAATLTGTPAFTYTVEAYPHGYTEYPGVTLNEMKRVVRTDLAAFNATPQAKDFQAQISSSVSTPSDLITYSYFTANRSFTACNDGADGITGGVYSSFSHFGIGTNSSPTGAPLPVKLLTLTATPVDNKYIRLDWITATEIDNKGFAVERSVDGETFENIGWVDGHGNSNRQIAYSYDDKTVSPNTIYYYRLSQVDYDGASDLTNIVSASLVDKNGFLLQSVRPNPANDKVTLQVVSSADLGATVSLTDILGREISSQAWQIANGLNTMDLDLTALASGPYNVVIKTQGQYYTKKLVVSR